LPISCAFLNAADDIPSVTALAIIEEEVLPTLQGRAVSSAILNLQLSSIRHALMLADCKVEPLADIEPGALAFEKNAESDPADIEGLMPDTAQALDTFRELVTSAGGTFELKSAYRSTAYQAHHHDVWVKWVKQLRNNRTSGC
jgi:hypothetical protein